jgi:hypothetical protein
VCGGTQKPKLVSKPGGVGNLFTRVSGDKCGLDSAFFFLFTLNSVSYYNGGQMQNTAWLLCICDDAERM